MTQPLRASHCAAYARVADAEVVIIAPDESPFVGTGLPERVQIRHPVLAHKALPTNSPAVGKLRQRVIRWARGGSRAGMKFDQLMRSAQWRMRHVDRLASVKRLKTSQARNIAEMQAAIRRELEALHSISPISRIVVFDVFDLSTALAFGRANDIPVEVR